MPYSNSKRQELPSPISPYASRVHVKAGDSWLLAGKRGSGKTTLARRLLATLDGLYPTSRIYILDSKHTGDFAEYGGIVQTNGTAPSLPGRKQRYQVWQPRLRIPDEMETWLSRIELDPPGILLIDELAHLIYKKTAPSDMYTVLQKVGRGLPVATITLTQEFSGIPGSAVKQAVHTIVFRMGRTAYESSMAARLLDVQKFERPSDRYGFYYQHEEAEGEPQYYSTYQKFLGG